MDSEVLLSKAGPFLRRNFIPLGLGIAGVVLLIYGLIHIVGASNKSTPLTIERSSRENPENEPRIVIDIEGAIIKPGVYELKTGSRTHEVMIKAGGLSSEADRDWFEKNINLASKLTDGQKIYIPRVGEDILTSTSTVAPGVIGTMININQASIKDLDNLPGIGPVTAQKIIDGRPYAGVEELLTKKIVTSKVFVSIKDKIAAN